MIEINEFDGISGLDNVAPPPASAPRDDLGQEDFLKLMITQFRNQDPFEPMDNGQFLGQIAQFGTVNGIEELNSAFAGLQDSILSEQALQATSLVGHAVLATSNSGFLADEGELAGAVELDSSVSNLEVEISDLSGQVVRRLELGEQPPGLVRFSWDGNDADGERAAAGAYQISTRVIRGSAFENAETLVEANVESVSLGRAGQAMTLNVQGGDTLTLADVRRIL